MCGCYYPISYVTLYCRYVDRIANAKWEVKELGLEHNGLVSVEIKFCFPSLIVLSYYADWL